MQLEVNFDQNTSSLPSGFVAAIDYVAGYYDSLFTANVTVTINVGFGEIAGQALGTGALGESEQTDVTSVGYSAARNALIADNAPRSSTLPASTFAPGARLYMASAEQKALGLMANNNSVDGYVGFDATPGAFSYAINSAPPSSEYYFVGVVEHEFSEIMGRTSYLDYSGAYSGIDLFRYAASGERQLTTGAASYFSINGGATNLDSWNNFQTGNNGDLGDWAPSAGYDAFDDNSYPGVINALSPTDITLMNAIGWESTMTSGSSTGVPGLLWQNPSGLVTVWAMNGAQVASASYVTANGTVKAMTPDWQFLATGDFFGNNPDDILWHNNYNGVSQIWNLSGTQLNMSTSGYITANGAVYQQTPDWQFLSLGDFFAAGTDDILLYNKYNGVSLILELSGTQINMDNSRYITGYNGVAYQQTSDENFLGTGDFFGDGHSDILWQNPYNGVLLIWQMNGTQINLSTSSYVTSSGAPHPMTPDWNFLATGDFFHAGTADVLWQNPYNDVVQIWEMSGTQINPGTSGYVTLNGSAAAAAASVQGYTFLKAMDFNGDGYTDIAWRNTANGDVQIWEMNGTQIINDSLVTENGATLSSTVYGTPIVNTALASPSSADTASNAVSPGPSASDTVSGGALPSYTVGDVSNTLGTNESNPFATATATGTGQNSGTTPSDSVVNGVLTDPVINGNTLYIAPETTVDGSITFAAGSSGASLFDADGLPDTVMGFGEGTSYLSFSGQNAASEAAVIAAAQTIDGNTLLTFPDQTSLLLIGVNHVDTGIFT